MQENKIEKVAAILNLKLNEEFKIDFGDNNIDYFTYRITQDGLERSSFCTWFDVNTSLLNDIIVGKVKIIKSI